MRLGIYFKDDGFTRHVRSCARDLWCRSTAWTTPTCPEVHKDWDRGVLNDVVKHRGVGGKRLSKGRKLRLARSTSTTHAKMFRRDAVLLLAVTAGANDGHGLTSVLRVINDECRQRLATFNLAVGGAFVLYGPLARFMKSFCGVQRPIGIAEKFPSEQDNICLPRADNLIRLLRCGDHADRTRWDIDFAPNAVRERNLVACAHRDLLARIVPSGRAVHKIDTFEFQELCEGDGILHRKAPRRNFA